MSDFYYLANIVTNINDKSDDFTKRNDNFISWQVDDKDRYGIDVVCK